MLTVLDQGQQHGSTLRQSRVKKVMFKRVQKNCVDIVFDYVQKNLCRVWRKVGLYLVACLTKNYFKSVIRKKLPTLNFVEAAYHLKTFQKAIRTSPETKTWKRCKVEVSFSAV